MNNNGLHTHRILAAEMLFWNNTHNNKLITYNKSLWVSTEEQEKSTGIHIASIEVENTQKHTKVYEI